jgi:hypothetical protein
MNEDNNLNCFSDDYLGPNCLYKLIDNRSSNSGRLYLNRNLRYKEKVQKKVPESYCISIKTIPKNVDRSERYLIALVSVNLTSSKSKLVLCIHDINDKDITHDGEINLKIDPNATISKDRYEDSSLLLIITTTLNESNKYHDEIQQKLLSYFKLVDMNNNDNENDNDLTTESRICIIELIATNIKVPNTINFKMLAERRTSMYRAFPLSPLSSSSSSSKYINATLSTMNNGSDSNDNIDIMINIKYGKHIPLRLSKENNGTLKRKHGDNQDNTCDMSLFFHYIFKDNDTDSLESIVEKTRIIGCPFCKFNPCSESKRLTINPSNTKWTPSTVKRISCLVEHMEACHIHFKYDIYYDRDRNLHVFTVRDRSQDDGISYRKSILKNFNFYKRKGQQQKLIEAVPAIPEESDIRKTTNVDRNTDQKISTQLQLYHATTGIPALDEEFSYNSDDDIDNSQALMQANLDIFEFEDISLEEKRFMCLWNNHINSLNVFADSYLLSVCTLFIHKHANYILGHGLRHNLLLHLLNLYDCNLLRSEEIPILMAELDIVKAKESV